MLIKYKLDAIKSNGFQTPILRFLLFCGCKLNADFKSIYNKNISTYNNNVRLCIITPYQEIDCCYGSYILI